jgi:hypothetical protein
MFSKAIFLAKNGVLGVSVSMVCSCRVWDIVVEGRFIMVTDDWWGVEQR